MNTVKTNWKTFVKPYRNLIQMVVHIIIISVKLKCLTPYYEYFIVF